MSAPRRTLADRLFEPPADLLVGLLFRLCGVRTREGVGS